MRKYHNSPWIAEIKCPVCGKNFIPAPYHAYKTHFYKVGYITCCSWHCLSKAKQESERLKDNENEKDETKSEWIALTNENMPTGEVIAANFAEGTYGYGEMIIGYICKECGKENKFFAESEAETLWNVTHYMPKPAAPRK